MKSMVLLLFALSGIVKVTYGNWVMDVEFQNVIVLHQLTYDKDLGFCCCDDCKKEPVLCNDTLNGASKELTCSTECSCETILNVCINFTGQGVITNSSNCYQSSFFFRDAQPFGFFKNLTTDRVVYDPLRFTITQPPPSDGKVRLEIMASDQDNDVTVPIDSITVEWNYETGSEFSEPTNYISDVGLVQLTLAYRMNCAEGYYGDTCDECCTTTTICNSSTTAGDRTTMTVTLTDCQLTPSGSPLTEAAASSCAGWQITTVVLFILFVFGTGMCCASCCILVFFWRLKKPKRDTTALKTRGGIMNPSYHENQLKVKESKEGTIELQDYEVMHGTGNNYSTGNAAIAPPTVGSNIAPPTASSAPFPIDTTKHDLANENYEVMSSPTRTPSYRTDFTKIPPPTKDDDGDNGLAHTYERIPTGGRRGFGSITESGNDNDIDEYEKLKHTT